METPHRREIKTRNKHPVPLLENKSDKKPPLPILENHNLCLTFPSQLLADINNPKENPPFIHNYINNPGKIIKLTHRK